jgi:hypothetical protein
MFQVWGSQSCWWFKFGVVSRVGGSSHMGQIKGLAAFVSKGEYMEK